MLQLAVPPNPVFDRLMVKPLGLIHMTHGDIKRLEGALKVTLPQRYTELLLRYPAAFEENGFHFGDGFEPLSKRFFVKDIDRLIELNETAGAAGERLADEAPWPAHLFAIGENAGGDYYLLDLGSVIGRVLFFNRQIGTLEPCADSLEGFIERILHQAEEFNFWHSPHSPPLDALREERRRLMCDHVARTEKANLFDPRDGSPPTLRRPKGR